MSLCKWRTSSPDLLDSIPPELRETSNLTISSSPSDCPKSLGIHWDMVRDSLFISLPDVMDHHLPTKRVVASLVARIFDALGWFSPATLPAKALLQQTWALTLGWDDLLPDHLHSKWEEWVTDISSLADHPIPRHFGLDQPIVSRQLHGFADASTIAYGGAVYMRTFYANKEVSVDLVSSKTRLTPLKLLSIPRLELCGALVLAQLLDLTADDLRIDKTAVYAWADSTAVLGWLHKAPSRLTVFVANRVVKITTLVKATQWRYIESETNPADILSRGSLPSKLLTNKTWWKGPPWLSLEPALWPRRPDINFDRELPDI